MYLTDQFTRRYHEQSRLTGQLNLNAWRKSDCPHPSQPQRNVPARIAECRPLPLMSGDARRPHR